MPVVISVIVTIYNAEQYLNKCLDSIADQSYQDIEIILVNDGSSDRSEEICNRYIASDQRFRLVNKQNGGVSSARNEGIEKATGDYLAFVDSDDCPSLNMLEILCESMVRENSDLVIGSFLNDYGMKRKPDKKRKPYGAFHPRDYFLQLISDPFTFYYGVVWNKLFRRSIIEQYSIRFNESISYMEDWSFLMKYLKYVKKIVKSPEQIYCYNRANINAITRQELNFYNSFQNRMQGYNDLLDYATSIGAYEKYKDMVHAYLLRYLISQKFKILLASNKREALQMHKDILKKQEIIRVLSDMSKSKKVKFILYYHFIYSMETTLCIARTIKRGGSAKALNTLSKNKDEETST